MQGELAKKYASVLLQVGVDLKPGQHLYIQAPLEAVKLVRELTKQAYEMGASFVKPLYYDILQDELRAAYSQEEFLSAAPRWEQDYMEGFSKENCAFLKLACVHNIAPGEVSPQRLAAVAGANMALMSGYRKNMNGWKVNWTSVIYPTLEWAELAYPDLSGEAAMEALMGDFSKINYLDQPDPVASWKAFRDDLGSRCEKLNALEIETLRYDSPTAQLTIRLVENSKWVGGAVYTEGKKHHFMGNIPTAEAFNVPHKYGVDGRVKATLPLNYNGTLIEGIDLRFEGGRVVEYHADRGYEALKSILETDEGAMHLGEVALVPASSPISRCQRVFMTTLYDENAACHLALGNYCSMCTGSAEGLPEETVEARGINKSKLHVDFMMGSDQLTVTARCRDGKEVVLMRRGEWTDEF